ncbi:hypothetical protein UlMin_045522 [Ulmus minor]
MPRPGPRPYECVRRAWHSDRHQPMRGSIIQQIFRVANEAHGPMTRKNKEWLDKLPLVVLKAEEIMYSKANSEAEYTNSETLWERVNDAINTIIRRDESTETGNLLPPCVEAALNLGCIPIRASRSQRHSNPRFYLTPRAQEPSTTVTTPTRVLDETSDERHPQLLPVPPGNQSNFGRISTGGSSQFLSESNTYVNRNNNIAAPQSYSFSPVNMPVCHNQETTMDSNTPLNLGSVYPLYYGTHYQTEEYQLGSRIPENSSSQTIYVGMPVMTSTAELAKAKQNCFSRKSTENASNIITNVMDLQKRPREEECDLSLSLGLFSPPIECNEKSLASQTEDVGSSISQEVAKMSDMLPSMSKEFCFFPGKSSCNPLEPTSRLWSSMGEGQNSEATMRKGKEPFSRNEENGQFCWKPEVPFNLFNS